MVFLLAAALSVDALGIGITYGLRNIKVPLKSKLVISLVSALIAGAAILIGKYTLALLNANIANDIGVLLLVLMGIWIIAQGFKDDKIISESSKPIEITINIIRSPVYCDFDSNRRLCATEAVYMGIALSIDSIGAGIGSSLAGAATPFTPLLIGLFQMIFLWIGEMLGVKLQSASKIKSNIWNIISGTLLIIIALFRL